MGDTLFSEPERLDGVLDHIIYRNEENGYTVARLKAKGRKEPVCITGDLSGLTVGERLRCEGAWTNHPRFGMQFKVESYEVLFPATRLGIIKYLGGGSVKGVGPKLAEKMVDHFGTETLKVIDEAPERLLEISGIGVSRQEEIKRAWSQQKGVREVMVFFQGYGLGAALSTKIYRHYGRDAIPLVKENPYRLSEEIFGFGFKTADRIALNLGVAQGSPFRIRAALAYLLEQASGEGHMCLPYQELARRAAEFLGLERTLVEDEVDRLADQGPLVVETADLPRENGVAEPVQMVFTRVLRDAEETVARLLNRLRDHARPDLPVDVKRAVAWAEKVSGLSLEPSQRDAVAAALEEPVLIITGGPGVGKTTIIRCITRILKAKGLSQSLAAPTGRAAKRLSEATGMGASTIHRLLKFNPHTLRFEHDEHHPLSCDVLIVDESSMLDVPLMEKLVRAVRPEARLILVGDVDQLPSVGPGVLLRSLIACGRFPVMRLTTLFRQEEGGGITLAAHDVNGGRIPRFTSAGEDGEIFFMEQNDGEEAAGQVVHLVRDRIPDRFGLDPMEAVQVMTPMHKGAVGTENLNRLLQEALNPAGEEIRRYGKVFREGDKVMQIRNNYNLNVFNGDIGFVTRIDPEEGCLKVRMDERRVEYNLENLDELMHAYCISVHKSQGSEFPAVVIPLLTQHYLLLRRNLLYTGITRAQRLLVLVGSKKAVRMAVSNNQMSLRYSRLEERLKERE